MAAPSVNLLSWLRPQAIEVAYAGRGWQLQASTAADWIGAIAMDFDTLTGVFPGLVTDEDIDEIFTLLVTQPQQDPDPMRQVACNVVQAAGGRDWWWTVNLTRRALGSWILVNGFLVRQGVRVDSTSLPDWLDACYTWFWEKGDENQRIALDMELSIAPKGVKVGGKHVKQMLEAFQAD